MEQKLAALKKWLNHANIDAVFLNDPLNIAYFSGYKSNPHERLIALLVFADADPFLFTPALEKEDAKNSSWKYDVFSYLDNEDPWKIIADAIKKRSPSLDLLAVEKDFLIVDRYEKMILSFPSVTFTDISPMIQKSKLIKSSAEIERMVEAGKWADIAFKIGFNAIEEGASEQAIVAEIEYKLKKLGIKEMSFETMVLAGDNAASPHGIPGNRQIQKNEFVLFDLGVVYGGYTSDATRTVAFGNPSKEARKIYDIVLDAHNAALNAIKPGITAGELDSIARTVITKKGYGPYFNHRLGHGIGSSIHEAPSIIEDSQLVIQEGMCFSIEPGIYVPGVAGVRIEDCVHVTQNGFEVFTHTPKMYTSI